EARAVLPRSVPLRDAVFNVQRVALLLAGLQARRPDALVAALEDRLHQPYRRAVFPWMPSVAECAHRAGCPDRSRSARRRARGLDRAVGAAGRRAIPAREPRLAPRSRRVSAPRE